MGSSWSFWRRAAEAEPSFQLLRSTEVTGVVREGDRVVGVTYRDPSGETKQMRADLTVACDGRGSTVRSAVGLKTRTFGTPMDMWWFRLPRQRRRPEPDLPAPSSPATESS